MLIQCPSCRTTYRVKENVATIPNPTFRCSRCKHIFAQGLGTAPSPARETSSTTTASRQQNNDEGRELSFSFPPAPKKPTSEERNKEDFKFPEPIEPPTLHNNAREPMESPKMEIQEPPFLAQNDLGLRDPGERPLSMTENNQPSSALNNETEDSWSITSAHPKEESFDIPQESRTFQIDTPSEVPTEVDTDPEQPPSTLEQTEDRISANFNQGYALSTLPYLSLFCCFLLFYSVVSFVSQARPQTIEPFIKAVPWLGSSVIKNSHLRLGVDLKSIRPSFMVISENREVFVISGAAVNHNPASVRGIQVEGNIYNAEGKEIERQTIWVGNAISPKIIRGMTGQELSDIQKLPPLKRFEISPEESTIFAIVFFKPSGEIKYFSYRVLSADETT